jgi:hypothetical protein
MKERMITRETLEQQEKVLCECGHRRLQHWVGGGISDCDKCDCREYRPRPYDGPQKKSARR